MKKSLIILCATLIAMASCNKEIDTPEPLDVTEPIAVTFNLNITHPDIATKAVKTGWEVDDVVFVFFSTQTAPAYLEMKWNGSSWVETNHGLSLVESESGTMTAVFLPFGSDATVSASGTSFVFSKNPYSYYLIASSGYTVTGGVVEGTFDMQIPAGFVQFFVDNASASSSDVIELREPHLTPVCIASISAAGSVVESALAHGAPLPGYVYDKDVKTGTDSKGYLFSGILASEVRNVSTDYNFTLVSGGFSGNYYSKSYTGKTFYRGVSEGRAIKLPVVANWTPITDYKPIDLGMDIDGKRIYWAACNLGADNPHDYGDYFAWGEVQPYYSSQSPLAWKDGNDDGYWWTTYQYESAGDGSVLTKYTGSDYSVLQFTDDAARQIMEKHWRIPTNSEWQSLLDNCTWTWQDNYLSTGVKGYSITKVSSGNFIFLPAAGYYGNTYYFDAGVLGYYWSSVVADSDKKQAKDLYFTSSLKKMSSDIRIIGTCIRPVTE